MSKIYEVRELLQSLKTIESDSELTKEFRKKYGTEFTMIETCIKDELIKTEAINLIVRLVPICYKIGDKVFLKGDTKGNHDFVGDNVSYQPSTELFDITTEMKTGDSYSFYVSSCSYFDLATPKEILEVINFLVTI